MTEKDDIVRITIQVEPELKAALESMAANDPEVTVSSIIRRSIRHTLGLVDPEKEIWFDRERGMLRVGSKPKPE